MVNSSPNLPPFPEMKRLPQINSYFCGPASLQMLLSFLDINIEQQHVVDYLKIHQKIIDKGMTIPEMGAYIRGSFPHLQFWYKFNGTITDITKIINSFNYPVGVEWQGIFDYPDDEINEDEDDDPGHLAVITAIDTRANFIQIADPDSHYAGKDRRFSILQFERRWWDINEIIDPVSHRKQEIDDYHGLYLIAPKTVSFPGELFLNRI